LYSLYFQILTNQPPPPRGRSMSLNVIHRHPWTVVLLGFGSPTEVPQSRRTEEA